ncbi:MAG: GMC family oxidoreductase N-terminal domain-containing protein, partial [archaeon]|nr:GMC family oxidoreductase N-terminal domain-containing protein [archaeon]
MFTDANDIAKGSVIEADVCIIGAGAAGITVARSLKDTPLRVVMLESGGVEKSKQVQKLNDIETTDLPVGEPHRARQFGGTTTLWVGRWKPHDAIDFEERSWIENSGWPISLAELEPYYEKASSLLSAPEYDSFSDDSVDIQNQKIIAGEKIKTSVFRWLAKKDFNWGKKYKEEFGLAENIQVLLKANVTKLQVDQENVASITIQTTERNMFSVKAKEFVLAAGGLENPRLLLLSDIGNQHDQVGRYYMDHPKELVGEIEIFDKEVHL